MTDKPTESGELDVTGAEPTTPVTKEQSDQQTSADAAKLQSTLETLTKRVDEIDKSYRTMQGDKDRGVKRVERDLDDLKKLIGEYETFKTRGLEPDAAIEEVDFRQSIRELKQTLQDLKGGSLPVKTGTGTAGGGADDADRLIEELGLSANDPEVVTALRGDSPTVAIARLAQRRASQPASHPAAAPPLTGGGGSTGGPESLKNDYIREMLAARGKKMLLKEIKEKYRKLGAPVDNITFSV